MTALAPTGNKRPFRMRMGINALADLDTVPVNVTSSTLTLSHAAHAGRVTVLNLAAGIAITLPSATGTGDVYTLVVETTFTGASTITCASGDTMLGTAILFQDAGDTVVGFAAAAGDHIINLMGTANANGGIAGERIELIDVASTLWIVTMVSDAGGTEATPFAT